MAARRRVVPAALLAAMLLVLLLAGCGRKTLPIPPQAAVPATIDDLRYHQDDNRIVLSWTFPTRTAKGSKLPQIESFEILRAVIPEAEFCPGCPVKFSSTIELDARAAGDPKSGKANYTETLLRPGQVYIYTVRTRAGWRIVSDDSNQVAFIWDAPPAAPADPEIAPGDASVSLTWHAPTQLVDGRPLQAPLRYQIYRGTEPDNLAPVRAPVEGTSFTDTALSNGTAYVYRIRAVMLRGETRILGMASRELTATPSDQTPPSPPRSLESIQVAAGVQLIWDSSPDADVAGYRLYRRLPEEKEPRLLAETGRHEFSAVDSDLPQNAEQWYYSVTAFDRASPPNESIQSLEKPFAPAPALTPQKP